MQTAKECKVNRNYITAFVKLASKMLKTRTLTLGPKNIKSTQKNTLRFSKIFFLLDTRIVFFSNPLNIIQNR